MEATEVRAVECFQDQKSCCEKNNVLQVEYLFWRPYEDQVAYGIKNGIKPGVIGPSTATSKQAFQNFEFSSGYRLSALHKLPWKKLDVAVTWTDYHSSSSSSTTDSNGSFIASGITGAFTGAPYLLCDLAKSDWNLDFNVLKLDFGFNYLFESYFKFRPFVGALCVRINQRQKMKYFNVHPLGDPTTFSEGSCKKVNDFYGAGVRAGFDLWFDFNRCLALVTTTNIGVVTGRFHLSNDFDIPENSTSFPPKYKNRISRVRPMVDSTIGLRALLWEDKNFVVKGSLNYECQYWWQQWQVPMNPLILSTAGKDALGDLVLNGMSASLSVQF